MPGPTVDRTGLVILLLATVIGVWLGLAGPDLSPVAPPLPPVPATGTVARFLLGVVGGSVPS